jgi:hypothetical protein
MFSIALLVALSAIQPASPMTAQPPKPEKICRESVKETGSHIRTGRRCKTADEWARIDARNNDVVPTLRKTAGQGDGVQTMTRPQ